MSSMRPLQTTETQAREGARESGSTFDPIGKATDSFVLNSGAKAARDRSEEQRLAERSLIEAVKRPR